MEGLDHMRGFLCWLPRQRYSAMALTGKPVNVPTCAPTTDACVGSLHVPSRTLLRGPDLRKTDQCGRSLSPTKWRTTSTPLKASSDVTGRRPALTLRACLSSTTNKLAERNA